MLDPKLSVSDLLGDLHKQLCEAMDRKDLEKAEEIRARMEDLLGEGKEDERVDVDLDFNDEFVRKWYNEGW